MHASCLKFLLQWEGLFIFSYDPGFPKFDQLMITSWDHNNNSNLYFTGFALQNFTSESAPFPPSIFGNSHRASNYWEQIWSAALQVVSAWHLWLLPWISLYLPRALLQFGLCSGHCILTMSTTANALTLKKSQRSLAKFWKCLLSLFSFCGGGCTLTIASLCALP